MQILVSQYPTSGIWHSVGRFEARGKAHAVGASMEGRQERMDDYIVPVLPVSRADI